MFFLWFMRLHDRDFWCIFIFTIFSSFFSICFSPSQLDNRYSNIPFYSKEKVLGSHQTILNNLQGFSFWSSTKSLIELTFFLCRSSLMETLPTLLLYQANTLIETRRVYAFYHHSGIEISSESIWATRFSSILNGWFIIAKLFHYPLGVLIHHSW